MKRIVLCFALCVSAFAAAQTQDDADVFAPFATRILASVGPDSIAVSWSDAQDVEGTYLVYRSTQEITRESLTSAVFLAEVAKGIQNYVDSPPDTKSYYYCILAKDKDGTVYDLFIPFKNKTMYGVAIERAPKAAQAPARITSLSAKAEGEAIVIRFEADRRDRRLILYRSTQAITKPQELLKASIVDVFLPTNQIYYDYPVPGIDYYYALIDEEELQTGKLAFVSGGNATKDPTSIGAGAYRIGLPSTSPLSRTLPLPYFVMDRSFETGIYLGEGFTSFPQRVELSTSALKAAQAIAGPRKERTIPMPAPVVLDEELKGKESTGDAYTLRLIVQEKFSKGAYDQSLKELAQYLSLHRTEEAQARARFYLGQCYMRTGDYRAALFEFLLAEDRYYAKCQPFIDYVVSSLR